MQPPLIVAVAPRAEPETLRVEHLGQVALAQPPRHVAGDRHARYLAAERPGQRRVEIDQQVARTEPSNNRLLDVPEREFAERLRQVERDLPRGLGLGMVAAGAFVRVVEPADDAIARDPVEPFCANASLKLVKELFSSKHRWRWVKEAGFGSCPARPKTTLDRGSNSRCQAKPIDLAQPRNSSGHAAAGFPIARRRPKP